jgi:hypothetical protein
MKEPRHADGAPRAAANPTSETARLPRSETGPEGSWHRHETVFIGGTAGVAAAPSRNGVFRWNGRSGTVTKRCLSVNGRSCSRRRHETVFIGGTAGVVAGTVTKRCLSVGRPES